MNKTRLVVLIAAALVFMSLGAVAKDLEYADGILLIRFYDDVNPIITDNNFVKVDNPEMDRLFVRFRAYDFEPFFGTMKIKNPEYSFKTRNDYKIFFPDETNMRLVAAEFRQLKGIELAEPDWILPMNDFIPNDPYYEDQWWLHIIDAAQAWDYQTGNDEIIVGAIDTGVDWHHPDLINNLWVNPGEDLDDDHRPFDPQFPDMLGTIGDWNFEDDDDNGLEEDFIGYDWVTIRGNDLADGEDGNPADYDPMDFNGHGTGCNSALAEVGDNGTGCVGVAFNCRIMCLRAGWEGPDGMGYSQTSAAANAMAYASEMGATVLSMSYGGSTPDGFTEDATDNAWAAGLLLFAAAGNEGRNQVQYPANYTHVIAVAATNENDQRANFSNYGNWVDVCAPGVNCLTGWYLRNNPSRHVYVYWDGTSVSTPIAAGVGALVAAQYTAETNTVWRTVVEDATDYIPPGARPIGGRVNAYRAVTQYYWPSLTFDDIFISDPDGNGHPDIGETIEVSMMVTNAQGWQDAQNVTAHLEFDVEGLQIDQNDVLLAQTLLDGQTADNFNNPLQFTVPNNFPNGAFVNMRVSVTAQPHNYEIGEDFHLLIGTPQIILVDDDGGDDYETFIMDDLNQLGFVYNHHDVDDLGDQAMSTALLSQYTNVIWMTGDEPNPLSQNEINSLQGAMNNGTNVFLFGQTLDEQLTGTGFYRDYLHAQHVNGNGIMGLEAADNAPQPPIVPNSRLALTGLGGAGNNSDPDIIAPIDGAVTAYEYANTANVGGIIYEGENYKAVYFAFAFEATSGQGGTTPRQVVLGGNEQYEGILQWFGFEAPPPPPENHFEPVSPTGRPYAIVVEEAILNGEMLQHFDEIGVFDEDLCVGAEIVSGNWGLPISAWQGDDAHQLPGFTIGHPILFRIWSYLEQREYTATATYIRGNGTFGFGAYSQVSLEADANLSFTAPLARNYFELVSTYLVPAELDASVVFGGINNLEIVYQDDGDIYIPHILNTIDDITITEGYQVFCMAASEWTVEGVMTDPTQVYETAGRRWNWISYPFDHTIPLTTALSEILDDVEIIMTDDGRYYIPPVINTIRDMTPAEGYYIFSNNDLTFTYNTGGLLAADDEIEVWEIPAVDGAPQATGLPYVVLIDLSTRLLEQRPAIIEIYDGTQLVGKAVVLDDRPVTPVVAWMGSDEFDLPGFISGNPIQIEVKNAADGIIESHIQGEAPLFGVAPYAQVTLDAIANYPPLEFSVGDGYPNPFNPTVTVPFALPENGEVRISVFNVMGQEVFSAIPVYEAGQHHFIFDSNSAGRALVSGMYFLSVQYQDQISTQKVMLLK